MTEEIWRTVYKNDGWNVYNNPRPQPIEITTFDNNSEKYKEYINIWNIIAEKNHKLALINSDNNRVRIPSISRWNIKYIENCDHVWEYGSEQGIDEHPVRYCIKCNIEI